MVKKMDIKCFVQARMGSSRLPGKVLKRVGKDTLIEFMFKRLKLSKKINQIFLATSDHSENNSLCDIAKRNNVEVYRGDENNVLNRFYRMAKFYNAKNIIRITADCPLIDPEMIDEMIDVFFEKDYDYLSNTMPPTYPDGLDIEIFKFNALEDAYINVSKTYDKEHVTPYIRNNKKIKIGNFKNSKDYSHLRWTVDEKEDLIVVKNIISSFKFSYNFKWKDVLSIVLKNGECFNSNKYIKRNEGANMSDGQKIWKRAKKIIPGGNMLLSKRPEMFLPEIWPSYFDTTNGCEIIDLDKKKYFDFCLMGVGTNTLGYSYNDVDNAVIANIKKGNMSTLNCKEEVELAEKLVEMHPWAQMVRFGRTGGETASISIRIARAASGRDKVAVCGYHGWQDWYLAANLASDDNLDGHLLPGLEPKGVPRSLEKSIITFNYNDIEAINKICKMPDVGVIMMEVARNYEPENEFLKIVRDLATKNNIVLIFDECSSGFRETFGGLHLKYNVVPDMAWFGKALGNGYAITAVIGKDDIMSEAQSTFISSTFWTERIGPTAALATLKSMEKENSWIKISEIGKKIKAGWIEIAKENNIKISVGGLDALSYFVIKSLNQNKYKTFITQEMLKRGFLASNSIYASIAHKESLIKQYLNELNDVFKKISLMERGITSIDEALEGSEAHSGFKRLN